MRKLNITNQVLNDYYENRFQQDLAGCFLFDRNDEGIKVVVGKHPWPDIFYNRQSAEKQMLFYPNLVHAVSRGGTHMEGSRSPYQQIA